MLHASKTIIFGKVQGFFNAFFFSRVHFVFIWWAKSEWICTVYLFHSVFEITLALNVHITLKWTGSTNMQCEKLTATLITEWIYIGINIIILWSHPSFQSTPLGSNELYLNYLFHSSDVVLSYCLTEWELLSEMWRSMNVYSVNTSLHKTD